MTRLQFNISSLSTNKLNFVVSFGELKLSNHYANMASSDDFISLGNTHEIGGIVSAESSPADTTMPQKFHEGLQAAIDNLPEVFRIAIMLRETQNLSYEEIAEITGVSSAKVKSRIARARYHLQAELKQYL